MEKFEDNAAYVTGLVARARAAQEIANGFSQEYVDKLTRELGWALVQPAFVEDVARFCLEETQMGNFESKLGKLYKKVRGVLFDINPQKTVGVVEENALLGIRRIAKPVGVIGSLIPTTQPELCPATQGILAVKSRNAIIFAPHPRSQKTTLKVTEYMREVLKKNGAPEDLLICAENPTMEMSDQIMKQTDLVIATGGAGMVKAAYSSGTPAYGVGVGNAVVVIDETADLKAAAHNVHISKVFDYASGCSCENALVVKDTIYDEFIACLKAEGGYMVETKDKDKLEKAIWPDGHTLNRHVITQPAKRIGDIAGISEVPADAEFIMVEETGRGKDYLFSGEKLCVVLAVYKYGEFNEAIRIVNEIHAYQGAGHSCGIQSNDEAHILALALNTKTTRVMVRQPQSVGNSGDWHNGMPFTGSLGCGTWGGNIISENITLKHFLNNTWLSVPIDRPIPTDRQLFGDAIR
ncbi:MAG TPA: aldehyde dehydrogenase family protein [Anaerovoracaceae bacterium]|nr:aldehyde dehydrogenase family protein [Anaerovoracaceae bacterium]